MIVNVRLASGSFNFNSCQLPTAFTSSAERGEEKVPFGDDKSWWRGAVVVVCGGLGLFVAEGFYGI